MEITKDSSISDVLREFPESVKVFDKYNMGCLGCLGAAAESIENGALMHGLDAGQIISDIKSLIDNSNSAV